MNEHEQAALNARIAAYQAAWQANFDAEWEREHESDPNHRCDICQPPPSTRPVYHSPYVDTPQVKVMFWAKAIALCVGLMFLFAMASAADHGNGGGSIYTDDVRP